MHNATANIIDVIVVTFLLFFVFGRKIIMVHISYPVLHGGFSVLTIVRFCAKNLKYSLRNISNNDLRVPDKPMKKCQGFTYNAAKLYNKLPNYLREIPNSINFKAMTKDWIWDNIPSY